MPTLVGNGDGLRRLVLGAILVLVCALISALGYGSLQTAPRIAKWLDDCRNVIVRSHRGGAELKPTIPNVPDVHEVLPAGPRALQPRNPPGSWVRNEDYPRDAQRAGEQGAVSFMLFIDARGTPQRCEVTASSGSVRLDRAACDLLVERARFIPALDADGHPIAAQYSNRFRWVLSE